MYVSIFPYAINFGEPFFKDSSLGYVFRSPEKYWDLRLPHKLPPKKEPLNVNGLPMLGYLEQTVAQVLTKALTVVGNFKPKYPFMSATQSALVYLALQLKGKQTFC